jgi:signal transduction histidine kinase
LKKSRNSKVSLKWKIGRLLIGFCALVLIVVFVFQIVLLEPMYEANKVNQIRSVADSVEEALTTSNIGNFINSMQNQSDTCIMAYTSSDSTEGETEIGQKGCILYSLSDQQRDVYVAAANKSKNGTYLAKVSFEPVSVSGHNTIQEDTFDAIIYTKVINNNGSGAVIMVSGTITPINATTSTLKWQLLYIAIFMVAAVLILILILYKQIAKPLTAITAAARQLPMGKYEVNPNTNQYEEAQELNNTLSEAAKDIKKADKAKRDLISNVSHDLRTPLTMISGYGEMMMDLPEEKTDENIQVIVDESKRLNSLVNDLLDLSRLQDNRIVLHPEVFDISELIIDQLKKYEVYRLKEGYTIESCIQGEAMVKADPKRMEQVFNNFMTNAVNYGGAAKHIIVREKIENGSVKIEIQDFGEGIAKEDLKNVWERYYKVDKEHVRVSNGSGIGLAIVKEVLELHHAEYGVASELGKGSTFWFELPIVLTQPENTSENISNKN